MIPPESPNYVDIPDTWQTDFIPPRRPKGIFPVPREIFPPRQPDKPSKQYLSRAIPARKASSKPTSKLSDQEKYKSRMTNLRRSHLRSGLLELYNRKVTMTQEMAAKSTRRQNERARLMTQPPREDERLTNTSIPTSMRITAPGGSGSSSPSSTLLNDPTTAATIHARRLANVEKQERSLLESRRDALHTLYMHARAFITTERQLNAEIARVFDNPETEWGTAALEGENIWNLEPPTTVATMLQESSGGTRSESRNLIGLATQRGNTHKYRTDQRRMKRIAEVLSGGKI